MEVTKKEIKSEHINGWFPHWVIRHHQHHLHIKTVYRILLMRMRCIQQWQFYASLITITSWKGLVKSTSESSHEQRAEERLWLWRGGSCLEKSSFSGLWFVWMKNDYSSLFGVIQKLLISLLLHLKKNIHHCYSSTDK